MDLSVKKSKKELRHLSMHFELLYCTSQLATTVARVPYTLVSLHARGGAVLTQKGQKGVTSFTHVKAIDERVAWRASRNIKEHHYYFLSGNNIHSKVRIMN